MKNSPEQRKLASERTKLQMASIEVRHKLAESTRRSWKRSGYKARFEMTPEIRAKISAAQKGRPRLKGSNRCKTPEDEALRRQRISASHTGVPLSPEHRHSMSESRKKAWAEGRVDRSYLDDPERNRRISDANRGQLCTEQQRKRISDTMKQLYANGRVVSPFSDPEQKKWNVQYNNEDRRHNPLRGRFDSNCAAVDWSLRAPDGAEFRPHNLCNFVRKHPELFEESDLVEKRGRTNAVAGLGSLRPSPGRRKQAKRWKGWTWLDDTPTTPLGTFNI